MVPTNMERGPLTLAPTEREAIRLVAAARGWSEEWTLFVALSAGLDELDPTGSSIDRAIVATARRTEVPR